VLKIFIKRKKLRDYKMIAMNKKLNKIIANAEKATEEAVSAAAKAKKATKKVKTVSLKVTALEKKLLQDSTKNKKQLSVFAKKAAKKAIKKSKAKKKIV